MAISNAMTRDELEDMTNSQLAKLGNSLYGLSVNKDFEKTQLIEMIVKAQGKYGNGGRIAIADSGTTVRPGEIKIRVSPGKYNEKNRPVFVSVNCQPATIPVNVDVIIPAKYETCLKDAVQAEYYHDTVEKALVRNDVLAYPYSVLERG